MPQCSRGADLDVLRPAFDALGEGAGVHVLRGYAHAGNVDGVPKLYFFIPNPQPDGLTDYRVGTDENVEFSRVPCVGEYVNLGNDTTGVSADYEVVLVHHAAGRPNDTDAEVYLHRVDMLEVKKALPARKGRFDIPSTAFPESAK